MESSGKKVLVVPNEVFFAEVSERLSEGESVTIAVKGFSMYPFMRNGKDKVRLVPPGGRKLEKGDVILFRYRGNHVLHRIYACSMSDSGSRLYITRGDGNTRGTEYASLSDIIGVMSGRLTPEGRMWNCDSVSWKICSSVWMRLLPVRRWCLAVLRRIYR